MSLYYGDVRYYLKKFNEGNFYTVMEFCISENLNYKVFLNSVNRFQKKCLEKDKQILMDYKNKTGIKNKSQEVFDAIYRIYNCIKYEYTDENGIQRPFDSIDFKEKFNISINELYRLSAVNFGKKHSEIDIIKKRVGSEEAITNEVLDDFIYKTNIGYGFKRDKKGNIIPNSGTNLSSDEKLKVYNYLKNRFDCVTFQMLRDGCRRYYYGYINLDDKTRVKKI